MPFWSVKTGFFLKKNGCFKSKMAYLSPTGRTSPRGIRTFAQSNVLTLTLINEPSGVSAISPSTPFKVPRITLTLSPLARLKSVEQTASGSSMTRMKSSICFCGISSSVRVPWSIRNRA